MVLHDILAEKDGSAPKTGQTKQNGILPGHRLLLARYASTVLIVLLSVFFIASLPPYFAYLHRLNGSGLPDSHFGPIGQITPAGLHTLQMIGLSLDFYAWYQVILRIVLLLVFTIVGGVLFWQTWGMSSKHMALLASFFLVLFPITFNHVLLSLLPPGWTLPGNSLFFLGSVCLGLFFSLFPTGRFVPHWTRWLLVGWIVYWAIDDFLPALQNSVVNRILFLLFLAEVGSLVWVQVYRYRQVSTSVERQQTKWVVFGAVVCFGGFLIGSAIWVSLLARFSHPLSPLYFLSSLIGYTLLNVLLCLFPLFLAFAILRSRLWDIDIIIRRTLVYGTLTASVTGFYMLFVVSLGTLLRAQGNLLISLLATGLIAVLFQPLRLWVQRVVNRLLYGERDDPYKVISRLGQRLETTLAPDTVLPVIVETVAQALKLPYAAICLKRDGQDVIAAFSGQASGELTCLPLVYQHEQIGELRLAPRAAGEAFSSADRALLDDLARQAGSAVHAIRLTMDLQRLTRELQHSRQNLVTAREEERRRLRRDLHDGLGSVLTSLNWRAGALRRLLSRDPTAADTLLVEQQQSIQAAIADIRRLIYDLRPPALDELGLAGAIRECATQQGRPPERHGTPGLRIEMTVPDPLPALPAAVEVAAYRIVQEALANVSRHAQAQQCAIRLQCLQESLHIEVTDDGTGLPAGYQVGVGLLSMRERAAELGGSCEILSVSAGGTRVRACLPLARE